MDETSTVRNRIFWLDLCRFYAIICVVFNHSINRTFVMKAGAAEEAQILSVGYSVFKAFMQVLSRTGVPIFLMITGALLLGRDFSDEKKQKTFYQKNYLSLFVTAEIWYAIIYIYRLLAPNSIYRTEGLGSTIINFFLTQLFINQKTFSSMWYMSMILCVYLVIPFLAIGLHTVKVKYIKIPIYIAVLSGFVFANLNSFFQMLNNSNAEFISFELSVHDLFSIYLIYIIFGYYISKGYLSKINTVLLSGGIVACFVVMTLYQQWAFTREGGYVVTYNSIAILIVACLLFELMRRVGQYNPSDIVKRVICKISQISFGIYFVHICVMEGIKAFLPASSEVGYIKYFMILFVSSFLISVVVIIILEKNKKISRLLFRID